MKNRIICNHGDDLCVFNSLIAYYDFHYWRQTSLKDEISEFTPEEFNENHPPLDISRVFCETDISYDEESMLHT